MHDTSNILITVTTSYFWTVNSEETYCNFICQDYNFNCHHASMQKLRCDLHAYNNMDISESEVRKVVLSSIWILWNVPAKCTQIFNRHKYNLDFNKHYVNIVLVRLLMHDTSIILLSVTMSYFLTVNGEETYCNFICHEYKFYCHHTSMQKLRCDLHAHNHIDISEYIQISIQSSIHTYIHPTIHQSIYTH